MPVFAFLVLFAFLELFLMVMATVEHGWGWGWGVFGFEVATAFLGVALIRHNQELTMREMFRQATGHVRPNLSLTLLKSARVTIGGILLILPGFITDGIGAALLILPAIHSLLLRLLKSAAPPPRQPPKPPDSGRSGRIVEGEVEPPRKDPENRESKR